MKKKCIIFFCFIVFSFKITAQIATPYEWVKGFGGTYWDVGNALVTDAAGNVYTTGYFGGVSDFDPGTGVYNLSSYSPEDIFVTKLDPSGNFVWAINVGGGGGSYSRGKAICIDASGNICVSGNFQGTADFDPGTASYLLSAAGANDVFILKLDPNGNFICAARIGGFSSSCTGNSITTDSKRNILIAGMLYGTADFDPGLASYTLASNSSAYDDGFIAKYDSAGNFIWANNIGGSASSDCFARSVAVDTSGNVFATGGFYGVVDFDSGPGIYAVTSFTNTNYDVFITKLTSAGNFIWAKKMGGNSDDESYLIDLDKYCNIYCTGMFQGTADFDPGIGTYTLSPMATDIFISKLDSSGNFVWAKQIGGGGYDVGCSLKLDPYGNVFTAGTFETNVDFDPGPGTYTLGGGPGVKNIFISKLDSAGNFVWARATNGTSNGFTCNGIALDNSGNVFATGGFWGGVNFNVSGPVFFLVSAGNWDCFIFKISPCDALSQKININNVTTLCSGTSMVLLASGASTYSWNTGATSSTINISPTINTTYSVVGVTALGCTNSAVQSIIVNPSPTINAVSNNSLFICLGQSTTLTATGASSYTWNTGGSGSSIVVSPTITTSYSVSGSNSFGCSNSVSITQSVSACTGMNNLNANNEPKIFPSPFTNKITIVNDGAKHHITIYNSLGAIIYETTVETENLEIDTGKYNSGIYFVRMDKTVTKIVKE
jgi:hypothetical protein